MDRPFGLLNTWSRVALLSGLVWFCQLGNPAAQQGAASVFRAGVDLVHLDVSVLDRDRRPVRGLTAADFTVLDDGEPQPVVAFSAIDIDDVDDGTLRPRAAWLRDVASDVRTNEDAADPQSRLFAIVIDDALLPADPGMLEAARRIARGVVSRVSPTDQVAVIYTAGGLNAQGFTSERAALLSAIDRLKLGYATYGLGWDVPFYQDPPGRWNQSIDQDIQYRSASFDTLRRVADVLIAAPQRRKSMIFIGPGITIDNEGAAEVRMFSSTGSAGAVGSMLSANSRLVGALADLFRRLQQANVTVYPMDPGGLGGFEAVVTQTARNLRPLRDATEPVSSGFIGSTAPPRPEDLGRYFAGRNRDFLEATAANTGGFALLNNDIDGGLDRMFRENTSYYLIGYALPSRRSPNSQHRLTVRVNRPDLMVRTRSGYTVPPVEKASRGSGPAPAETAIAGPVPGGDLALRVSAAPVAGPDPSQAVVTLTMRLRQSAVATATEEVLELRTRAFTPDGQSKGPGQVRTATFERLPLGADGESEYEFLTTIALAPGRYQIRVGGHRATDGVSGSTFVDVDVPDFARAPLSLSGVWIESAGAPLPIQRAALRDVIPIVPTAGRVFRPGDRVSAFFRIYQGGSVPLDPVSLTVSIRDQNDLAVVDTKGTVEPGRFDARTRAADHRFVLPTGRLSPGQYLLAFEATLNGAVVTRSIRFSIR